MTVLYSVFYVILFTSLVGSVFTLLALFLDRIFRISLPLWAGVMGMAFYVVPVLSPGLFLVSPEKPIWIEGYKILCTVWGVGIFFFALCSLMKAYFARRAADGYPLCDQENILAVGKRCAVMAGLKRIPEICFGDLKDPACVVGVVRPKIILNRDVISQLTEDQLMTVLGHEVIHIRRRHMLLGRIFGSICILNWFNPFVWLAKREFDVLCENDCDRKTLVLLRGKTDSREYALTMVRLLELSDAGVSVSGSSLSVSGFLSTKQRITLVMNRRTKGRILFFTIALLAAIISVVGFSLWISRGYFYPYPAHSLGIEYSRMEETWYGRDMV